MIDRAEILELASEWSLRPQVVEKDYVLGWLLAGIYQHPLLAEAWIFKGGTCLKKCYFETYRFSEDLDFTVTDEAQLDQTFLLGSFRQVAEWVYERTGIEVPVDQLRFEVFRNPRGRISCEGRVHYRGPVAPQGDLPRIKLDLAVDEVVVLEPQWRPVAHPYSDVSGGEFRARSYPFEEIFAEKIRALGERSQPRDLYDVISLFHRDEARHLASGIRQVLKDKCTFKGLATPTVEAIQQRAGEIAGDWDNMLGYQLPALPSLDLYLGELPRLFRWLEEAEAVVAAPSVPMGSGELVYRRDLRSMGMRGDLRAALETIRFAAANRLRVDLDYRDAKGERSTRRIEPYSLRRSEGGGVLLHAEHTGTREHRSYRIDRIMAARIANEAFVPRWAVELSPDAPLTIQPPAVRATSGRGYAVSRRAAIRAARGPTFVYECEHCGKKFRHTRRDPRLRRHKAPGGWACSGRTGHLVDTVY